ncbi:hypothetical protein EDD17DRAFT_1819473 [Pisolithus thermaeus]|nr:hypothetical protein EDD17DRAFT_1819473 [Pisolithus thermaeus]
MASSILTGTSLVTLSSTAPSTSSAVTPSTQQSASQISATTSLASASSTTAASPSSPSTSASASAPSAMSSTSNVVTTSSNAVTSQPVTTSTIPTSSTSSIIEQTSLLTTSSTNPPATPSTTSVSPSTSTSSSPQVVSQVLRQALPHLLRPPRQWRHKKLIASHQQPQPRVIQATVTGHTTIFVTTTNVEGQTITSAPSIVTQLLTSTNGVGSITTVTQAVVNPTLASNNSTNEASSFFSNTGAVVGVFVVVGLAAVSILLWILFAFRRRYRMRQIEHDSAIQAAVAAAGFNRVPLDDDEDGLGRTPHSHSQFSMEMGAFNPYADYPTSRQGLRRTGGYVPTRTASPPPGAERPALSAAGTDEFGSNRDRKSSFGHTPTYSAGSFEPLLSGYGQTSESTPNAPPTPPPRNPQRLVDASNARNPRSRVLDDDSSDGSMDDRLDPEIRRRTRSNSLGTANLRDDEDYSRPVLTVRNMPDVHSEHST